METERKRVKGHISIVEVGQEVTGFVRNFHERDAIEIALSPQRTYNRIRLISSDIFNVLKITCLILL